MSAVLVAKLERTPSSSKTSPAFSVLTVGTLWPELFRRWPKTGSMRDGLVYEHPTSVPPISDSDGSVLPTPRAQNGEPRNHNCWVQPLDQPQNIENAIARLLPTPTAMDMGRGKTVEEWDEWTDKMRDKHGNGNGHGRSLEIEAMRLLPTPDASAHKYRISGNSQQSKSLAALAKRGELTGDPTNQPSDAGNTSSDDQHPNQPTTATDSNHDSSNG